MDFPDELLETAELPHHKTTVWTATHKKIGKNGQPMRWYWKLHPNHAFGAQHFTNWARDCIRSGGFPVRFQWCEIGPSGVCLYDETLWGEDWTEEDQGVGSASYGGSSSAFDAAAGAFGGGGNNYEPMDAEPQTAGQRLIQMFIERPDYMLEAGKTIIEGFRPLFRNPDSHLTPEQLEYTVRRAVEAQLAETLQRAGIFDEDEDEDIFDDLEAEAEPEIVDAELVDLADEETEELDLELELEGEQLDENVYVFVSHEGETEGEHQEVEDGRTGFGT